MPHLSMVPPVMPDGAKTAGHHRWYGYLLLILLAVAVFGAIWVWYANQDYFDNALTDQMNQSARSAAIFQAAAQDKRIESLNAEVQSADLDALGSQDSQDLKAELRSK